MPKKKTAEAEPKPVPKPSLLVNVVKREGSVILARAQPKRSDLPTYISQGWEVEE